ncbi:nitroreductase family protein [Marinobacter daepoensis]|uniref:nitroreductase family protein n=1 Tax=Marinobacter daepoensis TaxID=262077 RepID=UPI0004214923|nr:nitroreductase [Marinobacter daepoensis]
MSSITRFILDRASEPRLEQPAPPVAVVDQAFQCASRAPDHALLRPWRYLVVEGGGLAALGKLFAACCPPEASEKEQERARNAPLRAPMVIVGVASPRPHPKVPEAEQVMSAAVGMSFISLALNEAGFGTMWRTGPVAYHSSLHEGLGLESGESVVGFLYTGTVASKKPQVPRPEPRDYVARWEAPDRIMPWQE